eukprot:183007-Pelagomonas_calceolata.AAC.4
MIIKSLNKSSWEAGLVNMDKRSDGRFTSSHPDVILITPYKAKTTPSSSSYSSSNHVLRSRLGNPYRPNNYPR